MTSDHHVAQAARAALEHLDAALERDEFATVLVTGIDGVSRLSVICRQTRITEPINVHSGSYWWPWGEAIGRTDDPAAAAHRISTTVHAFAGLGPATG